MIETAKAAADTASRLVVDPETYRYFFSASAQVFAAIFAVVAIAGSFRITEINRILADLPSQKRTLASAHKGLWDGNKIIEYMKSPISLKDWQEHIYDLAEEHIDFVLKSVVERCKFIIDASNNAKSTGGPYSIESLERIKGKISNLIKIKSQLEMQKASSIRNVRISVAVAGIATVFSLILLWFELYSCGVLVFTALCLISLAVLFVGYLFINSFSSISKSVQSVSSVSSAIQTKNSNGSR